jgi:hypothetical protein
LPKTDYYPLLAVLQIDMSEENLSVVVAEFLDGETVVIANDAAKAASVLVPSWATSSACAVDWRLPGGVPSWTSIEGSDADRRTTG